MCTKNAVRADWRQRQESHSRDRTASVIRMAQPQRIQTYADPSIQTEFTTQPYHGPAVLIRQVFIDHPRPTPVRPIIAADLFFFLPISPRSLLLILAPDCFRRLGRQPSLGANALPSCSSAVTRGSLLQVRDCKRRCAVGSDGITAGAQIEPSF